MNVVVLTGAGISQESGLATFRGPDGLWEGHRVEEVCTPQAFASDPATVHRFYNQRRRKLLDPAVQPNAAHRALADFEQRWPGRFFLITQNVDDLHVRAGSRNVIAMHGELLKARCIETGEIFEWREDLETSTPHPCDPRRTGRLRPHIVWFGEHPFELDRIGRALARADLFLAIGTSGVVYPAAGFVQMTSSRCRRVEINLDDTPVAPAFETILRGRASELVPKFLSELVESAAESSSQHRAGK